MEWKVGEIKQVNDEWYQCIKSLDCSKCDLKLHNCGIQYPCTTLSRKDSNEVIFKKLEKVGEPFYSKYFGKFYQMYRTYIPAVGSNFKVRVTPVEYAGRNEIFIEIKQNKEDIKPYDKNFSEGTVSNTENLVTSSLKPFDLEAAKSGKPVFTRDGRRARIICFDRRDDENNYNIVALVENENKDSLNKESIRSYYNNGKYLSGDEESVHDLMMLL